MGVSTFSGDYIDVGLRQLNAAHIKVISGKVHIVDFDLGGGFEVTYIFSITKDNQFHLQRANPYPMIHGKFATEQQILQFIKNDIARFRNAKNSKNFGTFVDAAKDALSLADKIENVFMSRNIDPEDLALIREDISNLKKKVEAVSNKSPEIIQDYSE